MQLVAINIILSISGNLRTVIIFVEIRIFYLYLNDCFTRDTTHVHFNDRLVTQ